MRPLITEKGCLECHAKQGYKENDIRGGISVSIPMKPLWNVSQGSTIRLVLIHLLIWLMGIGGIVIGTVRLSKSERLRNQAEETLRKSYDELEKKVQVRTAELEEVNKALQDEITERKRAEEEITIVNKELRTINQVVKAYTGILNLQETFARVIDESLSITGLEGGTICLLNPDETLTLAAHRATSEATILDLTTNAIKVGECLCGASARDLKPLILPDRETVLKFSTREATRGEDIRFHAAFPLITKGKCLGVLCVFTRTDKKPVQRSLKLLETLTAQIALTMENAQLYGALQKHAAQLEERVAGRTAEMAEKNVELERLNKLFVGRELRMIELKERIKELEGRRDEG